MRGINQNSLQEVDAEFRKSLSLQANELNIYKEENMNNCIVINNQKIELTEDQIKQIVEAYGIQQKQLAEYAPGSVAKIGDYGLVILEQLDGETAVILKELYCERSEFGPENNNYDGSYVDEKCQEFAQKLAEIIGWDNIVLHKVDLTSDDGLKDYGIIERRASLLTADLYRKFVEILDKFNPKKWWWLATPWSTKKHESDAYAKCVSPAGRLGNDFYGNDGGVRPFCILKSTIFVSEVEEK